MMFLALGASNCTTYTSGVICGQIRDNSIKPLPSGDISLQFARCRARCLDPNTWQALELKRCIAHFPDAKPGEMARNFPLAKCEGLAGFFVEDIATEIRPKMKALNAIKNDYCN
jgi:hypothetical protein